jgi:hypothetical protein
MTAWIMVGSDGVPTTRNMYDLREGFKELGEDIKTYTAADILFDTIPVSEDDIVVGHIDQCRNAVRKICGSVPDDFDYPSRLVPFMRRKFWKETLKDFYIRLTRDDYIPLFIKSVKQKQITGFVCRTYSDYVENCTGLPDDTELYVSEPVDFISEFRVYIHRHDIVNCFRYKGSPWYAPRHDTVLEMLISVKNDKMPIAYSIDVGILKDTKETVLVECNDGFALGNYGVYARKYAEMHRDRWYQMIRG